MSATQPSRVTWRDPLGSETQPWRPDFVLPSLFVSAAAVILAYIDPIHFDYQQRPILTIASVLFGVGVVIWGTLKARLPVLLGGVALLVVLMSLGVVTQPVQLGTPLQQVWPLRVALPLLVVVAWAFLMGPPLWARRALVAVGLPAGLALLWVGLPGLQAQLSNAPPAPPGFAAFWLATDSRGTLYASSFDGSFLWVFDPSGSPIGTLWPGLALEGAREGPGIRPLGFPTPAPTKPTPIAVGLQPTVFTFCGLATDPQDNLYVVDPLDRKLLRLNRQGNIAARLPLPENFDGAKGCLAADADYIYLSSRFGSIFILDHAGSILREVKLSYQPFGIAADGKGVLYVMGFNLLNRIEGATGEISVLPLPPPTGQAQTGYQALTVTRREEILATDLFSKRLARLVPGAEAISGFVGRAGSLPGQFQSLGGVAEDPSGRIYVADWQPGVIQRFTPAGKIDGILSAPGQRVPVITGEEGE